MTIDFFTIWNGDMIKQLNPNLIVYVPLLEKDNTEFLNGNTPLWCDLCYTSKQEARQHFWYRVNDYVISTKEMKFSEFFRIHFQEIKAMNSICEINRLQNGDAWHAEWGISI